MPAIIAAIAAGGLDFGSSYFGNKSEKKHRKRMQKRMNRAISTTEAIQGILKLDSVPCFIAVATRMTRIGLVRGNSHGRSSGFANIPHEAWCFSR